MNKSFLTLWPPFTAAVFLFLFFTGCQNVKPVIQSEFLEDQPAPRITLGSGDVIDVKFFYTPELNESQMVRPDGRITLQLMGEVSVQGKTPEELRNELTRLHTQELRNPEIAVFVRSLYECRVYRGDAKNAEEMFL